MFSGTVGMGIWTLPFAMQTFRLREGICIMLITAGLSLWSGFVYGQFKEKYPQTRSLPDAGYIMAGKIGRGVIGWAMLVFYIFVMGGNLLIFTAGLEDVINNMPVEHLPKQYSHPPLCEQRAWDPPGGPRYIRCRTIFAAISLVFFLPWGFQRRLGKVVVWASIGFLAIAGAIAILLVDAYKQSRWEACYTRRNDNGERRFATSLTAFSNIFLSFAGHSAYFPVLAELRDPREYRKALPVMQLAVTTTYIGFAVAFMHLSGPRLREFALVQTHNPIRRRIA